MQPAPQKRLQIEKHRGHGRRKWDAVPNHCRNKHMPPRQEGVLPLKYCVRSLAGRLVDTRQASSESLADQIGGSIAGRPKAGSKPAPQ